MIYVAGHSRAGPGKAWRGSVRHGKAWVIRPQWLNVGSIPTAGALPGMARRGMARRGKAWSVIGRFLSTERFRLGMDPGTWARHGWAGQG